MKQKLTVMLALLLRFFAAAAQNTELPVKEWKSMEDKPLILYISGDGGLSHFSDGLCKALSQSGYAVSAIDARAYFWSKKTPERTAGDITAYLNKLLETRKNKTLILCGYSFGADVMPFVAERLPSNLRAAVRSMLLISPSGSTDFEVHWADMMGGNKKRSMDVASVLNRRIIPQTILLFGEDEKDFPQKDLAPGACTTTTLPGGHDFDGKPGEVAGVMISFLK